MEERTLSCPASTPMAQNPEQTVYHSMFMQVFTGNSRTAYEQVILIDNNAFCIHKCNEYLVLKFEEVTYAEDYVEYKCTGFRDSRKNWDWRFDDEEDFPNGFARPNLTFNKEDNEVELDIWTPDGTYIDVSGYFEILEDWIEDYINKA